MMAKNIPKMPLPKLDDLFTTEEERTNDKLEKVIDIKISDIDDFPDHPFKVIENEDMFNMRDSIKENGVLVPALVRQKPDGRYEMVSGHRRKYASQLANNETLPCIVRNLTDDEAVIIMVDSNLQREEILPSEKAFAYKMKLEAMNKQAGRPKGNMTPVVSEKRTNEIVGEQNGESREQVRRYIRLTELIKEILDMVDEKKIAFRPAVEISYLSEDNQYVLLDVMQFSDITPSLAQAIHMKKLEQEGKLDTEKIEDLMSQEKPNQVEKLKFNAERFESVFPKNIKTNQEKEDFLYMCVEEHNQREKKKKRAMER